MPLHKIREFYPDYRESFDNHDVLDFDLYSGNEKVGSIDDLLVDDEGRFRYLVINTGAWIFGKKVLLPIGRVDIDYNDHKVHVQGLTRDQVKDLPEYDETVPVDSDHEERVRGVYRPMATTPGTTALDADTAGLNTGMPIDPTPGLYDPTMTAGSYDPNTYGYDRDPALYELNEPRHQNLKLYEERLIASKTRRKVGEVAVGKHTETETQRVSVPIEKERVIIERVNPTDAGTTVTPGADAFSEGEVARMEVYEETPNIGKETFVREEVRMRKEVDQETVESQETIRREELDVDKEGDIRVGNSDDIRNRGV